MLYLFRFYPQVGFVSGQLGEPGALHEPPRRGALELGGLALRMGLADFFVGIFFEKIGLN